MGFFKPFKSAGDYRLIYDLEKAKFKGNSLDEKTKHILRLTTGYNIQATTHVVIDINFCCFCIHKESSSNYKQIKQKQ